MICVAVELTFTAEFRSYNATENITKIKRSYKTYALHNNYGKFALLFFLIFILLMLTSEWCETDTFKQNIDKCILNDFHFFTKHKHQT